MISKNTTKYCFTLAGILIATITLWFIIAIPEYSKLPTDLNMTIEYDGENQIADTVGGNLRSERFKDTLSLKAIGKNGNILTIESITTGIKADTGKITFQDKKTYHVDQYTLMHTDFEGKRFGFLPGVEKQDYAFIHPLMFTDSVLVYQGTDEIDGLPLYVFETKFIGNDVTLAYPQFYPATIHSDSNAKLWVEPNTGEVIRIVKTWEDYVVENGQRKDTVSIGTKYTTPFTEYILIHHAEVKIANLRLVTYIVPALLGSIILGAGTGIIMSKRLSAIKSEMETKEKMTVLGNLTARISHDFRNPLNVISNAAQLLAAQQDQKPEEIKRKVDLIKRSVDRMMYQINDIMSYVKDVKLNLESVSLKQVLESSIENSEIPKTVNVSLPASDVTIVADSHKLVTMFTNILTNAVQAMNKTGHIDISMQESDKSVKIHITDSGPGIPKEIIDKIWEPLFTTKQSGTGLGLVSVKSIVEAHGGKISVKNNPTTFTIELPKNQNNKKD
ncbi:MAG: porin PorA family protein [Candidatus Nitrosotenuis sp.]